MTLPTLHGNIAVQNLQLSAVKESPAAFLDDLVDAFGDEEVPGVNKTVRPPFVDLPSRGLHMAFDIKGPECSPKLLYIPGATDDLRKTLTNLHFEAFNKKFRVLTCDLRNQGRTTPFVVDNYVPLESYVEDLIALVDTVFSPDETFHVAGWSFGAVLALLMARLHPNRVQSVAVLSGGYWEPSTTHKRSLTPGGPELFGKDWEWISTFSSYATMDTEKRCEEMLCHADLRRFDSTYRQNMAPPFQWFLDNFVRSENLTVCNSPRSCNQLGQGVLLQQTALWVQGTALVETISTPTIIIHGRHDGMHSIDRALALKEKMKSAMLLIREDEGHVLVVASVDIVTSFMQPQNSIKKSLQTRVELSFDRINQAFDEVSYAYQKSAFPRMLDAVLENRDATETQKEIQCHEICLRVQRRILDKYELSLPTPNVKEAPPQSWLGRSLAWVGCPQDSEVQPDPDCLLDVMGRRLEALERTVVMERKRECEDKIAAAKAKLQKQFATRVSGHAPPSADREDFIRFVLNQGGLHQVSQGQLQKFNKLKEMPGPAHKRQVTSGAPS